ncbi:heavy-metal-associated domain-containing protein [Rubritepida flocculans]|jgi:copper chaperone|uniref:heavy-metal-associated domain-containing protein n=1 Tax=Rubritepida flocculans TaxID=182403 RepID=UPI00040F28A5|nr:heavy-metal-associated domain-containing protein [Rubritepida flocculans]
MTRFHIPNMTCGGCAKGVTASLREAVPGVIVTVDLDRRLVTLEGPADAQVALAALQADGWQAALADSSPGH